MRPLACAALAVLLLSGCRARNPDDPNTWRPRLQDADPKQRDEAVRQLRRLKDRASAPAIAQMLHDPVIKEDAALALQNLGGPAEVPALLDAVDTAVGAGSDQAARSASRTNAQLATALANIARDNPAASLDPRLGDTLLRLSRARDEAVRIEAVQALGLARIKEAVPELSRLSEDEAAPPRLAKKAVAALGQIGDPAALPALQRALVADRQGVSLFPEASLALVQLGDASVEPLLALLSDTDPKYAVWAREHDVSPAGTYARAALVLGDLGSPRAVPALLAKLKYTDADPNPGTARLLSGLVRQFSASALGKLRAAEAAAPIQALVSTAKPEDEALTTSAVEALVWIGDRAQARELMKKAQGGLLKLRLVVAQGAALLGEPAVGKDLLELALRESRGAQGTCERELHDLTLPVDDPKQACALLATQFGELSHPLEAARACAGDSGCWQRKLGDADPVVQARAAYELGRAAAEGAIPALAPLLKSDQALVRIAAVRSLEWLAASGKGREALKALEPAVAAQLTQEAGNAALAPVDEELRRLQVRLIRL